MAEGQVSPDRASGFCLLRLRVDALIALPFLAGGVQLDFKDSRLAKVVARIERSSGNSIGNVCDWVVYGFSAGWRAEPGSSWTCEWICSCNNSNLALVLALGR